MANSNLNTGLEVAPELAYEMLSRQWTLHKSINSDSALVNKTPFIKLKVQMYGIHSSASF
jgi:hypothetical protein